MTQKEEIPQTEPAEIEQLIEQVKQSNLEQSAVDKLERLLRLILRLVELLQYKNVSLKRLRTMVFGPRTEKRKTSEHHQEEEKKEETAGGVAGSEARSEAGEKIETDEGAVEQRKPAGKGHGRRPAAAYRGAKIVECRHQQLKAGDQCPDPGCEGRLYQYYRPNNFIQFTGRPMLEVSQYKREVLRCAHCQERYPAPLPEGVTEEKYTATADATIALVKYGGGQPWYRLSGLLESMGVPFSESVMWERCEAVANAGLPVFLLLKRMAGDGEVLSIDDTGLTILEWEMEKQKLAAQERRGTQMSGIVVKSGRRKIAIYAGGRNHAGENVAELLSQRSPELKLLSLSKIPSPFQYLHLTSEIRFLIIAN